MKKPLYIYFKKGKVKRTLEFHRVVSDVNTKCMIYFDIDKNNDLLGIEIINYEELTIDGKKPAKKKREKYSPYSNFDM